MDKTILRHVDKENESKMVKRFLLVVLIIACVIIFDVAAERFLSTQQGLVLNYRAEIVSISKKAETKFFVAEGIHEEFPSFAFKEKYENGQITLKIVPAYKAVIQEDLKPGEKPYVENWRCGVFGCGDKIPQALLNQDAEIYLPVPFYVLHIPEGTSTSFAAVGLIISK
jgi:hypothetical protein